MMLDTWDGQIWYPRFYDIDTILSYDNSGEIKFDVDIEMEQGYWNTSSSKLWTKVRDYMHDELVEVYKDMRANGVTYESIMYYMYDEQIAKIPQTYYNKDFDIKYAPYSDTYIGKAHGDGYQHLKRWLKNRFTFCDTLFDYAPSYNNDVLTIRANTLNEMNLTIETYTPVYQHVSFYNGNMEKIKITPGQPATFKGFAQTETDQEVLIYGGSNIKKITGIQSMNPDSMLIGGATRLSELDISNCPILTNVNSRKANFSPHTYLNKLNISNCPQLGGNLNVSNSPLLQEIDARNTAITGLQMPKSLRNLKVLRLPNTIQDLTLHDVPLLHTVELDEGNSLQNISLSNCSNLTNCINFDLTKVPSISLDNSFDTEELYMSETTNLTLKNMSLLKRVIFTPNSEYSEFDINNVINGKNYKITTFNNPMMTDFITTAPFRDSYTKDEYAVVVKDEMGTYTTELATQDGLVNYLTGEDIDNNPDFKRTAFIEVKANTKLTINSTDSDFYVVIYNSEKTRITHLVGTTDKNYTMPEDGYIRFRTRDTDTTSSISYLYEGNITLIQDITPNTAFTANTLDLADTQFQNVKFLCTTDIYNLKVPTSMKNFYCDSAFDIDTGVIEDASYEVIHEELIEPYTTNYDRNVYRYETIEGTFDTNSGIWDGSKIVWRETDPGFTYLSNGLVDNSNGSFRYGGSTDFYSCAEGAECTITCTTSQAINVGMAFFDKDKNMIETHSMEGGYTKTFTAPVGTAYVVFGSNGCVGLYHSHYIKYQGCRTPNIIPSSASGSLIFNMYSNNTTQPTSTSPYMWDLTGLKLEDFYTYGMNNWVKPSDDSYVKINTTQLYGATGRYSGDHFRQMDTSAHNALSISPMLLAENIVRIKITTSSNTSMLHYYSRDYNRSTGTVTTQGFSGGSRESGAWEGSTAYPLGAGGGAIRLITFTNYAQIEWFDITTEDVNGVENTTRFYMNDISIVTADELAEKPIIEEFTYYNRLSEIKSITMPQRMPGYSVRLVNADITPDEYLTMLYPKLIDTMLPITGKLDYTKYNGTSLAWAYAYTTGDVDINPLDSRSQGNITQDYNKLYGTDYVDIIDVWIYKDTDVSKLSTNEAITKAYIELTNDNYKTKIDEVLQYYPNCTDLYLFEDGSVTTLANLFGASNSVENGTYKLQVEHITFMEGYFENCISLYYAFRGLENLLTVTNLPSNVDDLELAFTSCTKLTTISNIPSKVRDMRYTFQNCKAFNQQLDLSNIPIADGGLGRAFVNCSALTTPPILPNNYTGGMQQCFSGCTSLTQAPVIPNGVTNMENTFNGCTSLTTPPNIPDSVTNMYQTFYGCSSLTQAPAIGSGVTNMNGCFLNCTSLTTPAITPESVTTMNQCYSDCTALTTPPNIPNGCQNISYLCNRCSALKGDIVIPNSITVAEWAFRRTKIDSITLPLDSITSYGSMLDGCSNVNIIWVGERGNDFNVVDMLVSCVPTQEDIQELVPEHLDDLHKDEIKISFSNKKITINNTETTWE